MNSKKNFHTISRRNFILAAFACPLLIHQILSDDKNEEIKPLPSNKDKDLDFIILSGWVLLSDDLIENLAL